MSDGPPTAADMVHIREDQYLFSLTQNSATTVLQKLALSWSEVEDVFPIPDLSARITEAPQIMSYTIRASFITSEFSTARLCNALEATLTQ